jgi:hypothetical protein
MNIRKPTYMWAMDIQYRQINAELVEMCGIQEAMQRNYVACNTNLESFCA